MIKQLQRVSMIDMDIMHNVFGNNRIAMVEYLESFIELTYQLLKNIDHAIQEENKKDALDYFHKMKGSVGTIKFKKMYSLCERAEEKIIQADWVSVKQLRLDMGKILKKLQVELEKKIKMS